MAIGSTLTNRTPPTVGSAQGPTYASTINAILNDLISAVETKVTTAGLNINADLTMAGYNLTNTGSVALTNKSTAYATASSVYQQSKNLYFNNSDGAVIQLTSGTGLNAAAVGGIGGDYGGANPAAVSFVESTNTFNFIESGTKRAKVLCSDINVGIFNVSNPDAVTIKAPSGLLASYSLTLPTNVPATEGVLAINSSGVLSTSLTGADVPHGARTVYLSAAAGIPVGAGQLIDVSLHLTDPVAYWEDTAEAFTVAFPLHISVGDRITLVKAFVLDTGSAASMALHRQTLTTRSLASVSGAAKSSAANSTEQTLTSDALTETNNSVYAYTLYVSLPQSGRCYGIGYTFDRAAA